MAKNINIWRVLISGVIFAVISQIVHTIGSIATMKYYLMGEYLPVWSRIMMPNAGPPPASFFAYGVAFALITGILLAIVYNMISKSISGKSAAKKGLMYGLLLFFAAGIPGALSMYLIINLPIALIISWTVEGLAIYLLGGMVIAKINK